MSRKLASTIIALCASFLSVNALADTFAGKVLDGEGAPLIGAVVRGHMRGRKLSLLEMGFSNIDRNIFV